MPEKNNLSKLNISDSNGFIGYSKDQLDQREYKIKNINKWTKRTYENAQRYLEKYGEEDERTQTMLLLLDVSDYFLEAMDIIESHHDLDNLFNEIMGLFDASYEMVYLDQAQQAAKDRGFFARLKVKRKIKKAQKNNKNRIRLILYQMKIVLNTDSNIPEDSRKTGKSLRETLDEATNNNSGKISVNDSAINIFDKYKAKYED